MLTLLDYPFDSKKIIINKKSILKDIKAKNSLYNKTTLKIAIMQGSTAHEIKDCLELFLLKNNIQSEFYLSNYNKVYEESSFPNKQLQEFKPDIIYLHITQRNIKETFEKELKALKEIWKGLEVYNCIIIHNNFEFPEVYSDNKLQIIKKLNCEIQKHICSNSNYYLHDINFISSQVGLEKWHSSIFWHTQKYAISYDTPIHT